MSREIQKNKNTIYYGLIQTSNKKLVLRERFTDDSGNALVFGSYSSNKSSTSLKDNPEKSLSK